jgi:Polyketide cyclase / dehydrase and lipid transport
MQNVLIVLATVAAVQAQAQQTNTHFSHTLRTPASAAAIWHIWTDVPNWKTWDDGLKTAELKGPFAAGTTGTLIPDKGPTTKFSLTEVVPGVSYTLRTKLPLGSLFIKRTLTSQNGQTTFTHEVLFKGFTKGLFGRALGRKYRAILPDVMNKIKTLAESKPALTP